MQARTRMTSDKIVDRLFQKGSNNRKKSHFSRFPKKRPNSRNDLTRLKRRWQPRSANGSVFTSQSPVIRPFLMALTDLDLKPGIVYYFFYINSCVWPQFRFCIVKELKNGNTQVQCTTTKLDKVQREFFFDCRRKRIISRFLFF